MAALSPTILEKLKNVRVLCVGDVMLDRFLYGKVDRISPEAPVPVVHISQEIEMLGGAGNVVQNVTSLGAHMDFISVVGDDSAGRKIEQLLMNLPKSTAFLDKQFHQETTVKTRVIGDRQQLVRVDRENSLTLDQPQQSSLLKLIKASLQKCDVVILSDYGKGVLNPALNTEIISIANSLKIPVIIDPKSNNYADYAGATFITPNLKEFQGACGDKVQGDAAIFAAARSLMSEHNIHGLLVTRSQEGMSLVEEKTDTHITTKAQEVFDVSGAGDTVIATFALGLGARLSAEESAQLANIAAGIVVGKIGTATVAPDELLRALGTADLENTHSHDAHPTTTWDDALNIVLKWRAEGKTIGFTNGCFDILHPGHTTLLKNTRAQCDKLILGLNSDESVRQLKGPTRPVNDQNARAQVLMALESVDLVVVFGEETPLDLLKHLKPDLLIKGSDYTLEQVVGHKEVQGWGGEVCLVDLVPGHSTTATIERSLSSQTSKTTP